MLLLIVREWSKEKSISVGEVKDERLTVKSAHKITVFDNIVDEGAAGFVQDQHFLFS